MTRKLHISLITNNLDMFNQHLKYVHWEKHDYTILGDKGYLSTPVQLGLFETANITLDVQYRLNQKNWTPPTWAYKRFRKRIKTLFSQFNDNDDTPLGRWTLARQELCQEAIRSLCKMAAKVTAFTMLQYFNLLNHRPIGQVMYALF